MLPQILEALEYPERWKGLEIRYEFPHVDRIWVDLDDRICFHKIYPIPNGQRAFFHPHPWSSDIYVLKKAYWMVVGYSENLESVEAKIQPSIAIRLLLPAGSMYVMDNPCTWHAVEPIDDVVYSMLRIKERWRRSVSSQCLQGNKMMREEKIFDMVEEFRELLKDKQTVQILQNGLHE